MRRGSLCVVPLLLLAWPVIAQEKAAEFTITIKADRHERRQIPITVPLSLPADFKAAEVATITLTGGGALAGQVTAPGIRTETIAPSQPSLVRRDLHFILERLPEGKEITATVRVLATPPERDPAFRWWYPNEFPPTQVLRRDRVAVLGCMREAYDDSTPDNRNKTYKVFHHLYDPQGKHFVTNGGHTDRLPPGTKLQFPHHRGLYFGFNKVSYDNGKKKADTWHCQKDDHISFQKELSQVPGDVLGRHRLLLHWHGPGKQVFAEEEREVAVFNVKGGTLVEWSTLLKTTVGPVTLDGDPQHAGFQFRAANEVAAKTEKETYFLRPDGKGKPGETRNWPQNKNHVNLPWNAMCFKLGDNRYTAAYLDHSSNPKEARHSERSYGRFGYYFQHELTKDKPLRLSYRVWLQDGEMTGDQVAKLHRDFVDPPQVEVKQK